MPGEDNWELVSFVFSSEVRTHILEILRNAEATPSQLAKEIDQPISHVSRALKELQEKSLVLLLTPHRTKARLYEITDQGRTVIESVRMLRGGRRT